MQIAPSGYRRHAAEQRNPDLRCTRAKVDDTLKPEIQRVWQANMRVYGADKVWKQMRRERITVARCTVERLMTHLGLQGVRRGKVVRTTIGDMTAARPLDRVNRQFKADRHNPLWVPDFTYVSTWQGWQYIAFVIDVYLTQRASTKPGAIHVLKIKAAFKWSSPTDAELETHSIVVSGGINAISQKSTA